jgi:hypothetical protein
MLMGKPFCCTGTACLTGRTLKSAVVPSWGQKAQIGSANQIPEARPKQIGKAAATNGHGVCDGEITSGQFAQTGWKTLQTIDVETLEQNFCRSYSGTHLRTNQRAIGP